MRTYRAESNYQFTGADTEFITAALLNLATLQTLYPEGLLESSEIGPLQLVHTLAAAGPWFTATDGGSASTIVLTPDNDQTLDTADLEDLLVLAFRVAATNTGATTVRFSAGDATNRALKKSGNAALEAGDLIAGQIAVIRRNSANDNWELLTPVNRRDVSYVADSGGANALVATPNPAWTAYRAGMRIAVKVAVDNTTAVTLNVSGLGTQTVSLDGSALTSGQLQAGQIYDFVHDGSGFQVISTVHVAQATTFSQGNTALPTLAGRRTVFDVPHGLGGVPRFRHASIVCITADSPYAVGDEIDITGFYCSGSVGFVLSVNATNVKLETGDGGTISDRTGRSLTIANWEAKCFLQL